MRVDDKINMRICSSSTESSVGDIPSTNFKILVLVKQFYDIGFLLTIL